jgi:MinD superfamily P-loop ATPase
VLKSGRGEVFDYDFEKEKRDHKLERIRFTFNGYTYPNRGLSINDNCVNCGLCEKACSFNAISKGSTHYEINQLRCDACGDCTLACNFEAIDVAIK